MYLYLEKTRFELTRHARAAHAGCESCESRQAYAGDAHIFLGA